MGHRGVDFFKASQDDAPVVGGGEEDAEQYRGGDEREQVETRSLCSKKTTKKGSRSVVIVGECMGRMGRDWGAWVNRE